MEKRAAPRRVFRFDGFELDDGTGELRGNGRTLRLQDKPLRALVTLLERAGQVVTREDLRRRLWPDGVHVDYEQGLGNALLKVRDALGDSARSPRFVETLPRRGYRFLPAVTLHESRAPAVPAGRARRPIRRWVVAATVSAAAAAAALAFQASHGSDPSSHFGTSAREEYLRARRLAERKTPDGLQKSVAAYRAVLAADSAFAPAWSGLAEAYHFLGAVGALPTVDAYRLASDAARRALALDGARAEAHAVLAETTFRFGPGGGDAMQSFERALALDPGSGVIRQWYANYLAHLGRLSEALEQMRRAHRLDPLSLHINVDLAALLYEAGHRAESARQLQRTLDLDPYYPKAHFLLGRIHLREDRRDEAIEALQRAAALAPGTSKFQEALSAASAR